MTCETDGVNTGRVKLVVVRVVSEIRVVLLDCSTCTTRHDASSMHFQKVYGDEVTLVESRNSIFWDFRLVSSSDFTHVSKNGSAQSLLKIYLPRKGML